MQRAGNGPTSLDEFFFRHLFYANYNFSKGSFDFSQTYPFLVKTYVQFILLWLIFPKNFSLGYFQNNNGTGKNYCTNLFVQLELAADGY